MTDAYTRNVIDQGNQGSRLLADMRPRTIENSSHVEVLPSGEYVVRIPEGKGLAVHAIGASPEIGDLGEYAASLVDRLVTQAKHAGLEPIGFANIIDSRTGDLGMLETIADAMVAEANKRNVAVLNGENAILGNRVYGQANISGVMLCMAETPGFAMEGFACFDPKGKAVYVNADGVGTKTAIYERAALSNLAAYGHAMQDFAAMVLDDAIKMGVEPKVLAAVLATREGMLLQNPTTTNIERSVLARARDLEEDLSLRVVLHHEDVKGRILPAVNCHSAFDLGGVAVGTIDEDRLKNPLRSKDGDMLVAIRGKPNPRSNGITDRRRAMVEMFGENWHKDPQAKPFLDYLATPSTVFYGLFKTLIDKGLASNVFHMSGGAFNGKLGKVLAKDGFYVEVAEAALFPPDWREWTFVGSTNTPRKVAYGKWAMGNEAFVTTSDYGRTEKEIQSAGLESSLLGPIEEASARTPGLLLKFNDGEDTFFTK